MQPVKDSRGCSQGVQWSASVEIGKPRRAGRFRNDEASRDGSRGLFSSLPVLEVGNSCCFSSQQRAPGKVLLDAVCNHLNLVEGDYFGLEFPDHKKITVSGRKLMLVFDHLLSVGKGEEPGVVPWLYRPVAEEEHPESPC